MYRNVLFFSVLCLDEMSVIKSLENETLCIERYESDNLKEFVVKPCSTNDTQKFTYDSTTKEIKQNDMCITEDSLIGNTVELRTCDGSTSQKWLYDDSLHQIYNESSGNCLVLDKDLLNPSANPFIVCKKCQYVNESGPDRWISNLYSNGSVVEPVECDLECQTRRGLFIATMVIVSVLLLIFLIILIVLIRRSNKVSGFIYMG